MPFVTDGAAQRAEGVLLADPRRSDHLLATEAGVNPHTIWRARHRLERSGKIPLVPARDRVQDRSCRPARRPGRQRPDPSPAIPDLPPAPDFSRALCATSPPDVRAWWTSEDLDDRRAAALACTACKVLEQCREWALQLPFARGDVTIYAGMTATRRAKMATERRKAQQAKAA